jgi:hypothetical protein
MANKDEKKLEDESAAPESSRQASQQDRFDEDTDEATVVPRSGPEISGDDDDGDDERKAASEADSAFADLEIVVDEQEVKAESENQPAGRKY